ncbi:hypothetical protein EUGRSUZ_K02424 [Eucalyptus grandis]|uniref:Uncharacterized protein n=2 Tax=Eucalyptus grandis TaxID=71139 RepID=A0A059A3S9_EUCGR|nr:hypothetical protein EUGRSUZ_K02424 [Eucalyptus grandis]
MHAPTVAHYEMVKRILQYVVVLYTLGFAFCLVVLSINLVLSTQIGLGANFPDVLPLVLFLAQIVFDNMLAVLYTLGYAFSLVVFFIYLPLLM